MHLAAETTSPGCADKNGWRCGDRSSMIAEYKEATTSQRVIHGGLHSRITYNRLLSAFGGNFL